ncbi:MAG: CRISPR-associated protein Cas4 [Thermoprotei archaeon]
MVLKEIIAKKLLDEVADYYPPYEGEYYPSHLWKCLRQQYYERTIPHLNVINFGPLVMGTIIHDYLAKVFEKIEGARVYSEVPVRIPHPDHPEIVLTGRADDVILVEVGRSRYVVEVKTHDDVETAMKKGWIPKKEHVAQLNVYLRAFPGAKGILLYVDRSDFQMEEFIIEFDEELYRKTLERAKRLHEAIKNRAVPEAEAKQNESMSWMCRNCPFASICEKDDKELARNTKGVTQVQNVPSNAAQAKQ